MNLTQRVSEGELKRMMLGALNSALQQFALQGDKPESEEMVKREPAPLLRGMTNEEWAAELRLLVARIQRDHPLQAYRFKKFGSLLQQVLDVDLPEEGLPLWGKIIDFKDELTRPRGLVAPAVASSVVEAPGAFKVSCEEALCIEHGEKPPELSPALKVAVAKALDTHLFLANVMQRLDDLRRNNEVAGPNDSLAIHRAYALLDHGETLPVAYQSIGTSGFRRYQTSLSLADPGQGHLYVTVQHAALLAGTIVHVEHIDRDKVAEKDKLEPYRLSSTRHLARVRLHVGKAAPVTAFIGRPVFENRSFRLDLLKSANLTASACSSRFKFGTADCKIGMENMTALECIDFMRAVRGNVVRYPSQQSLSAAFNINTPLLDDRPDAPQPGLVSDPMQLARLGIELTLAGGFEKVTWDGASNQVPSLPILGQLSFAQLLELIHQAHEKGLETYISAGMLAKDMREAVYLGVGGVGIGTSLHYIDKQTKLMGQLNPKSILQALSVRDEAAQELRGEAARWLAWLDRLYFEGMLAQELVEPREALFEAMSRIDEAALETILDGLRAKAGTMQGLPTPDQIMNSTEDEPTLSRASRVIQVSRASRNTVAWSRWQNQEVEDYLQEVQRRMQRGDEPALQDLFS